ncbi:hypothetical protein [Acinetobacter baumannii]|uniref:hypothetical protein n=1 Tax=Acinetobacter baumannii TaxID=470 RepID=UPI001E4DBB63|nr:hypothetical protein [Acinetobacter baumannii]
MNGLSLDGYACQIRFMDYQSGRITTIIARVVNVAQGEEKGTYNITAVPHNPTKYQSIENDLCLMFRRLQS